MKKLKNSFLIGGVVVLAVLAILSALTLGGSAISSLSEKYDFESTYTNTTIDFIIPSPNDQQIAELEQSTETGISVIVPYYTTDASVSINSATENKSSIMLFTSAEKMDATPYCSKRILTGVTAQAGEAVVDHRYAEQYGVAVGDSITFSILGTAYDFNVVAISETNQSYDSGSIAVVLSAEQNQSIIEQGANYSGAFVVATDIEVAEVFLLNDYKPLGRMKDRSDFDSDEAYNQHVENFNAADWSKEITVYADNFSALSVNYLNTETAAKTSIYIICAIAAIGIIGYTICMLASKKIKSALKIVARKTKDWAAIKKQYNGGIVAITIAFLAAYIATLYFTAHPVLGILHSLYLPVLWMPAASAVVAAILAFIVTGVAVKNIYEPTVIAAKKKEAEENKGK